MARFSKQGQSLLILVAAAAIAVAACGSSSNTNAPGGTGSNGGGLIGTAKPTLNGGGGGDGGGLGGAAASLDNLDSYKFSMTLAGGTWGSTLSMFGGAGATGNAPFTMTGTIVAKPDKAADVVLGGFHIIEVNGTDYIDMGTGSFMSTPVSGSGMADTFSPSTMFSSMIGSTTTGYDKVGTEQKNGVGADHYKGNEAVYSQLDRYSGVSNATWTADVWIATSGGYPVSMAIIGTSGGQIVYETAFDLTNINDPANKVTAPTNVLTP